MFHSLRINRAYGIWARFTTYESQVFSHSTATGTIKIEQLEAAAPQALEKKQYKKAVSLYNQLESLSGRKLFDHELYNRAFAYRMLGKLEQAKQEFQRVVRNNESSIYDGSAALQIADTLYEQGDTLGAMRQLIRTNRIFPSAVKVHEGDETFPYLDKLVAKYSALLEKTTKNLLKIATTLYKQENTEEAMRQFSLATRRYPSLVEKYLKGRPSDLDKLVVLYYKRKNAQS